MQMGAYGPQALTRFPVYTERNFDQIEPLKLHVPMEQRFAMCVVAKVLPFRVNSYVIQHLIDWDRIPEDPIFQMTFPQREMLLPRHFDRIAGLLKSGATQKQIQAVAGEIHQELNPHPAEQRTLNVPRLENKALIGIQHKYRETVLFFPKEGQTCHSYCTFCFRWPQFVQTEGLRIAPQENGNLQKYLESHKEVMDLLITGGDPLVMSASKLATLLEPLLTRRFEHIRTIRIATKALFFWPHRFITDPDADALLRLFECIVDSERHLALMAHINHWREFDTSLAREAIRRIRSTGAVIRTQSPLLAHINDSTETWIHMWNMQVQLGMVPYYMFVARDTGARCYFEVPLIRALEIYQNSTKQVTGLARTVRGPSMSAGPGKVEIQGITEMAGERVFVLRFIQGRNPDWIKRPFFVQYDSHATCFDELSPAFGESQFFFEPEYESMRWQSD